MQEPCSAAWHCLAHVCAALCSIANPPNDNRGIVLVLGSKNLWSKATAVSFHQESKAPRWAQRRHAGGAQRHSADQQGSSAPVCRTFWPADVGTDSIVATPCRYSLAAGTAAAAVMSEGGGERHPCRALGCCRLWQRAGGMARSLQMLHACPLAWRCEQPAVAACRRQPQAEALSLPNSRPLPPPSSHGMEQGRTCTRGASGCGALCARGACAPSRHRGEPLLRCRCGRRREAAAGRWEYSARIRGGGSSGGASAIPVAPAILLPALCKPHPTVLLMARQGALGGREEGWRRRSAGRPRLRCPAGATTACLVSICA